MTSDGVFRRRKLPHWDVEEKPAFITAYLDGSIPAAGLARVERFRRELDACRAPYSLTHDDWERTKEELAFGLIDELLDRQSPVRYLSDDRQARIVQDAFLHFADERYLLLAYVVMPSHHHWLFVPDKDWSERTLRDLRQQNSQRRTPREIISHSVQSYTATMCNRARGASGRYWQAETFDHWARDEAEMLRIINYIEQNPVNAGLVERAEDWPWSSAKVRAFAGLPPGDAIRKSHVG